MYHYQHHIGDFNNATRHLSRIERALYRDLIELYYDTESQLPDDIAWICRRIIANECSTDVQRLLNEFFTKTPTGWYHDRCEHEIDRFRSSTSQKAAAGRSSAAKRAEKMQQALNGNSTGVQRAFNGTPTNQEPITVNQEPITNNPEKQSPPSGSSVEKWHAATCDLPVTINPPAWSAWCKYKSESKKPIKQTTAKLQWEFLAAYPHDVQLEIVEQSIRSGWQGLFEPKKRIESATEFIDRHTDTSWRDELNNTPSIPAIEFYGDKKTGG